MACRRFKGSDCEQLTEMYLERKPQQPPDCCVEAVWGHGLSPLCISENTVPSFWAEYNVSLWLPEVCQQNSHTSPRAWSLAERVVKTQKESPVSSISLLSPGAGAGG